MNIIITGGSRGIGYETAKLLSAEHRVISISRSATKNKLPGVIPISFDLEKGNIHKDLLPQIKKHFKSVDVLINNAASFIKKPFGEISRAEFEKIFRTNVFAVA
ncbi:MAG TPA: SDR family NAD(P)-dependent oxidoreductase, partial [Bacteroidia bacterium]